MKRFFLLAAFILTVSANLLFAQQTSVNREDCLFAVKGEDSLFLSRYYPLVKSGPGKRPVIIFAFGGGFFTGERNSKQYLQFFNYFAQKGYEVVTIDYRRGLRPFALKIQNAQKTGENVKLGPTQMVHAFVDAVNMAVSDMISATNFVISKADEWGIDKNKIVICGSSAGAITALQTEYYRSNGFSNIPRDMSDRLPDNFNYAGVVSFAGAVLSVKGKPAFGKNVAPIMFFHGNADSNVPYNKVRTPWGGLYGPEFLTKDMSENSEPYYFYTFNNFDHTIAVSPMKNNLSAVEDFLEEYIVKGNKLIETRMETVIGVPEAKKKFSVKDYIRSNF